MCEDVHSGVGRDAFRNRHNKVRINDCNVRCQFVIGERILGPGYLV